MKYRLFLSDDRLTMVRLWEDGTAEIARRESPTATWGPPETLYEESVPGMRLTPPEEGS